MCFLQLFTMGNPFQCSQQRFLEESLIERQTTWQRMVACRVDLEITDNRIYLINKYVNIHLSIYQMLFSNAIYNSDAIYKSSCYNSTHMWLIFGQDTQQHLGKLHWLAELWRLGAQLVSEEREIHFIQFQLWGKIKA